MLRSQKPRNSLRVSSYDPLTKQTLKAAAKIKEQNIERLEMTEPRASRSEKREWRDKRRQEIKLIFPTVINYVPQFFLFWEKQGYHPSSPPFCLAVTLRIIFLSSFSSSLCFIYSPWFTWDWWCSRLIVVIIPVLLLRCIMHNRPTKNTQRGGCKARLLFIGLLMHAGRSLLRSSSRTADDGDSWCVKTEAGGGFVWTLVRIKSPLKVFSTNLRQKGTNLFPKC